MQEVGSIHRLLIDFDVGVALKNYCELAFDSGGVMEKSNTCH